MGLMKFNPSGWNILKDVEKKNLRENIKNYI